MVLIQRKSEPYHIGTGGFTESSSFEQLWPVIHNIVTSVLNSNQIDRTIYQDAFLNIFKIAFSTWDEKVRLFTETKKVLKDHVQSLVKELKSGGDSADSLLHRYCTAWNVYCKRIGIINHIYNHYNRVISFRRITDDDDDREKLFEGLPKVTDKLAHDIWQRCMITPLRKDIAKEIFDGITNHRMHSNFDSLSINRLHIAIQSFVQVGTEGSQGNLNFYQNLEKYILDDTLAFYKAETEKIRQTLSVTQLIKSVNKMYDDDVERLKKYLHSSSFPKLRKVLTKCMMDYKHFIYSQCLEMLHEEKRSDLRSIYALFSPNRPDSLTDLVEIFFNHMRSEIIQSISSLKEQDIHIHYIEYMVQARYKYNNIIKDIFEDDSLFVKVCDDAFDSCVNDIRFDSAQWAAKYCGNVLKKSKRSDDAERNFNINLFQMHFEFRKIMEIINEKRLSPESFLKILAEFNMTVGNDKIYGAGTSGTCGTANEENSFLTKQSQIHYEFQMMIENLYENRFLSEKALEVLRAFNRSTIVDVVGNSNLTDNLNHTNMYYHLLKLHNEFLNTLGDTYALDWQFLNGSRPLPKSALEILRAMAFGKVEHPPVLSEWGWINFASNRFYAIDENFFFHFTSEGIRSRLAAFNISVMIDKVAKHYLSQIIVSGEEHNRDEITNRFMTAMMSKLHSDFQKKTTCFFEIMKKPDVSELNTKLIESFILLKYINKKVVFLHIYHRMLAQRLINDTYQNINAEEAMIYKLKSLWGEGFPDLISRKFEQMLRDIYVSTNLNEQLKLSKQGDVNLSVKILNNFAWPYDQRVIAFALPPKLETSILTYENFYYNNFKGRKLTWLHHLSNGELKLSYLNKTYIVTMHTYQMAILCLFETVDMLSFRTIQDSLCLPTETFQRHLKGLLESKLLTVSSQSLDDDTNVQLNLNYSNKRTKLKIAPA